MTAAERVAARRTLLAHVLWENFDAVEVLHHVRRAAPKLEPIFLRVTAVPLSEIAVPESLDEWLDALAWVEDAEREAHADVQATNTSRGPARTPTAAPAGRRGFQHRFGVAR
jgi:hypothetical protein